MYVESHVTNPECSRNNRSYYEDDGKVGTKGARTLEFVRLGGKQQTLKLKLVIRRGPS